MWLLRLAVLTLEGDAAGWESGSYETDRCSVGMSALPGNSSGSRLMLCAQVPLTEWPAADNGGTVSVPEGPRREAEAALKVAANGVAISLGIGGQLSSPRLPIAFRAADDQERTWLRDKHGVVNADRGHARARLTATAQEAHLAKLSERTDGMDFLAEALRHKQHLAVYRALLRFFERAFLSDSDSLIAPLGAFLASRPALKYSKREVRRWMNLRGGAVHADQLEKEVVDDGEVRRIIDRMLLAAYEVLFNKREWHSPDTARRNLWDPESGPLDPNGTWFVVQYSTSTQTAQLYDGFSVFPLDLATPGFELSDDCWPRRGPDKMTAAQGTVSVVPAEELTATIDV